VPELHPLELPADWNGAVQSSEQARNVLGDHMQASSAAVGVVKARYGSRFAALESFVARRAIRNLNGHRADGKLRIRFGRLPYRSGSFRRRCNGLCLRWQSTDGERCTRNGSTVLINSYDDQGNTKTQVLAGGQKLEYRRAQLSPGGRKEVSPETILTPNGLPTNVRYSEGSYMQSLPARPR
jgi:hypothetical protein